MKDLKDNYVLDATYTWGFYEAQSPISINYVARINGIDARPLDEPFTYCELGCGNGLTANVLAAAYPQGTFHAADLNPDHIRNGRGLAEEAKLANLTFLEKSFEDLLREDLPEFDYITLHGVYSWVSPEVRQDIVRFLGSKLKPGGLAYVSYNTMPGWAALQPLRQIMLSYVMNKQGGTLDKTVEGLKYLRFLKENDAAYFKHNPDATKALEHLLKMDPRYVAHEYFNASWYPQYFSEVASEMAGAGLSFSGSAFISRNYTDLVIPEQFRKLLNTAPTDIIRETHKSIVLNEKFRADIYCKDARFASMEERRRFLRQMVFGHVSTAESSRKATVGNMTINYGGRIFDDLIPLATAGTRSLDEICSHPSMAEYPYEQVANSVASLVAGSQLRPLAKPAHEPGDGLPGRLTIPSRFNRVLLRRTIQGEMRCALASDVFGSGLNFDMVSALLLQAATEAGIDNMVDRAGELLAEYGKKIIASGKVVEEPAKVVEILENSKTGFTQKTLPLLLRLGIVEAGG